MKKWKKVCIVGIVLIGLGVCLSVITQKSDVQILNDRWSMNLPEDMEEIEKIEPEPSFFGDGDYYYVYKVDNLNLDNFKKMTDEDYKSILETIQSMDEENKNITHFPENDGYYLRKRNSEEFIILVYSQNYLYIYESLL